MKNVAVLMEDEGGPLFSSPPWRIWQLNGLHPQEFTKAKKMLMHTCMGVSMGLVDCASIILRIIQQKEHYFKLLFQFSTAGIIRAFMRENKKTIIALE